MAMRFEHEFTVPVPVERAWVTLLDVEEVAPCMPGATLDSREGDVLTGRIKVKVGPITVTYRGRAEFTEVDKDAYTVTIKAAGKEARGPGTADATVRAQLHADGERTRVAVRTTFSVTGRPAQFGRGVMAEVGAKLIDKFAANLAARLQAPAPGDAPASGAPSPAAEAAPAPAATGAASVAGRETADPTAVAAAAVAAGPETPPAAPAPADQPAPVPSETAASETVPSETAHQTAREATPSEATPSEATPSETASPETVSPGSTPSAGAPSESTPAAEAGGSRTAGEGRRLSAVPEPGRPAENEALDLLEVAGAPVLKRAAPVLAALAAIFAIVWIARRLARRR
ncbi:SRPBCC family protein [Bailinhaonella thermotolerans]|uniref:Carbon monoxide dehydrogenase n=1 Tax=Bailinhaonella thermotolerans TaxID=1070861 RepID=A0A3A4ADF4_9ACTN|nr:SRPBCC family protein [Bailinhaonella thermotolerans]RJL23623.1 carbon monoxide dehydrogenase [Bailinhaonella thermotolerans]